VAVTGKGGVRKTTVAAHLPAAAGHGRRVVAVDADPREPRGHARLPGPNYALVRLKALITKRRQQ